MSPRGLALCGVLLGLSAHGVPASGAEAPKPPSAAPKTLILPPKLPDLTIVGFKPVIASQPVVCPPSAGVRTPTFRIAFDVKNLGLVAVNPGKTPLYPFVVVHYGAKQVAASHSLQDVLPPGGLANTQETWIPTPAGAPPYGFVATVDPAGKVTEQNEGNNTYAFTITIEAHNHCGRRAPAP